MQRNKILIVFLLFVAVSIFIAGTIYYRISKPQEITDVRSQKPSEATKSESTTQQMPDSDQIPVNFSETGTITNWDTKKEASSPDWTFVYEKPGTPVLNLKLEFRANSLCDMGKGPKQCVQNDFTIGSRAKIEGNRQGEKVVVKSLTMIAIIP